MTTVTASNDGFNLYHYHGLRTRFGRKYHWLDLESLCISLLNAGQDLQAVRYFTAPVRNDPQALRRQQKFWNALTTHCSVVTIERGRFQQKHNECRNCGSTWVSYEEKEADVGIAGRHHRGCREPPLRHGPRGVRGQ